jgi:hypothetical protein
MDQLGFTSLAVVQEVFGDGSAYRGGRSIRVAAHFRSTLQEEQEVQWWPWEECAATAGAADLAMSSNRWIWQEH